MSEPQRIVLSRTDSIGDVMLTLPMAGMIKKHHPGSQVIFLGSAYTRAVIEACTHVDEFVDWSEVGAQNSTAQLNRFKALNADVFIHVFPRKEIAFLAKRARIGIRIGVMRRWYQALTCNRLLNFTRKKSDLHEAQLNLKLLSPLGIEEMPSLAEMGNLYGFSAGEPLPENISSLIDANRFNLIIHPTSKGSAVEWSLDHYANLAQSLSADHYKIFVTGTAADLELIGDRLPFDLPHVENLCGQLTLPQLVAFIGRANGLIAASTGPLHIAAASGIHAIGLYASRRPIHPGRWAPIGKHAQALVNDPDCKTCAQGEDCNCINEISPERVKSILEQLRQQQS